VHTFRGARNEGVLASVIALLAHSVCICQVSKEKKGKVVDARCRDLTNSLACAKGRENPGSVELCQWHEVAHSRAAFFCSNTHHPQNLESFDPGNLIPHGIWTLADVLEYGREHVTCPYFTVRRMVSDAEYPRDSLTRHKVDIR